MDEGDRRGVDRLTIQEAARRLGISEGAVRKRVARGSLTHDKEDDGRVYVYLDAGGRRGVDDGQDEGQDEGVDPNSNALISQLRDEVAYLRDEDRRKDEIIMQQAMTMRQLSAAPPQEASESPETVEETSNSAEPHSATGEATDDLGAERARREEAETTLHEGMAEERRRREEAERERDELRRQLYARREPQEPLETVEGASTSAEPRSATGGTQEGARRPWWRRIFGG